MSLGFFSGIGYNPKYDIKADFKSRGGQLEKWRSKGYRTLYGTGVRSFNVPYINGDWDGRKHFEDIQKAAEQDIAWNGSALGWFRVPVGKYVALTYPHRFGVYYIVPTNDWINYRSEEIIEAIDKLNVQGIELDEPEFWNRAGYSEGFKECWRVYYKEDWQDPNASENARWKAEKLKANLLLEFISKVFQRVKEKHPEIECIVNPHSPFNYAEGFAIRSLYGGITSVLGKLIKASGIDGVLGEVWSDTIRTPILYNGNPSVEPFLHSYLDRSYFRNLTFNKFRLYHLLDPKSDDPKFNWDTYRRWFEQDILAAFITGGENFLVAWPERIFLTYWPPAGETPDSYKTVFMAMMSICRDMPGYPLAKFSSIGVPITDTIMWQRGKPGKNYIDGFYALTLPILTQGVGIEVFPLERTCQRDYLNKFRVLLVSFELWNPQNKEYVDALVEWVKNGGFLIYFGGASFEEVEGIWWKEEGYNNAQEYLFAKLGITPSPARDIPFQEVNLASPLHKFLGKNIFKNLGSSHGISVAAELTQLKTGDFLIPPRLLSFSVKEIKELGVTLNKDLISFEKVYGKGKLIYVGISPDYLAYGKWGEELVRGFLEYACKFAKIDYPSSDCIDIKRGPYRFVYAFNSLSLRGRFIDLLNDKFPVVYEKRLGPKEYTIFLEIPEVYSSVPQLLFSTSKVSNKCFKDNLYSFNVEGPESTIGVTIMFTKNQPAKIDSTGGKFLWTTFNEKEGILVVAYREYSSPMTISITC